MPANQTNGFGGDPGSPTSPGGSLIELTQETTGTLPGSRQGVMVGATDSVDGAKGAVPKPLAGEDDEFLAGDGTFKDPTGTMFPVDDTTSLVQDPVDNTKQTRIDTGAVATSTVRTIIMPDQDVDLGVLVSGLAGFDFKNGVETVATSNITLSGEQTINGVLTSGSRVGVVGQTLGEENGIYDTAAGAWTRAADADGSPSNEVTQGMTFWVGNTPSTKNGFQYLLTTPDPITVGTTPLSFTEIKRIELGTTAGTAAEGNDSRLSDERTADAIATTGADVNVDASGPPTTGQVLKATSATAATWQDEAGGDTRFLFYADHFDNPNNADWIVNALAPVEVDPTNNALNVRAFDVTAEEGIGFIVRVPAGATNMAITLLSRAKAGEAGVRTVGTKLYFRKIPEGAAISGTWAGGDDGSKVLDDLSFPATTEFYEKDALTALVLATEGIIADQTYQFEFTRIDPSAGTELGDDWYLLEMQVEFS